MRVTTEAVFGFVAPPADVFAVASDHTLLPHFFQGVGPVPAVKNVTLEEGGALRLVEQSDGSVIQQRVVATDEPWMMEFALVGGFEAPFKFLVKRGGGLWRFRPSDHGCVVKWQVYFELRTVAAYPLIKLLLDGPYRRAMYECLNRMSDHLLASRGSAAGRKQATGG